MKKYFGVAADRNGTVLPGATAQIVDFYTGVDAPLYQDDGTTPITNPMTCDVSGQFQPSIPDGVYNIIVTSGDYSNTYTKVSHFDDPDLFALENDDGTNFVYGELAYIFGDGLVKHAISDGTEAQAGVDVVCIDAVITPGSTGKFKKIARLAIAGVAGELGYLNQLSEISSTVPSSGAGDTFSTIVGKWFSDALFVFNPRQPVGVF